MIILTKLFFDKDSPFQRSNYSVTISREVHRSMKAGQKYQEELNELYRYISDVNSLPRPRSLKEYELSIKGGGNRSIDIPHYAGYRADRDRSNYYVIRTDNGKSKMPIYYLSNANDKKKSIRIVGRSVKHGLKTIDNK